MDYRAKQSSDKTIKQYFTCDGFQRYFTLAYEPNYVKVYLDDVLMNSLVDSNGDEAQDFLINKANKVVYIPENITTPFTGALRIEYRPTVQIIDYFEDSRSDNPYLLEKIIKNKDITNKMNARKIGKAEIKRDKDIKSTISFKTYDRADIGQKCYVYKPEFKIDGYYLVTKSSMNIGLIGKALYSLEMTSL